MVRGLLLTGVGWRCRGTRRAGAQPDCQERPDLPRLGAKIGSGDGTGGTGGERAVHPANHL